jgi:hypothetical protein
MYIKRKLYVHKNPPLYYVYNHISHLLIIFYIIYKGVIKNCLFILVKCIFFNI